MHATTKPRDVFFDDLVRQTAAGLIVPIEFKDGSRTHRFWVTDTDRDRYADLTSGRRVLPSAEPGEASHASTGASHRAPTCRPSPPQRGIPVFAAPLPSVPTQPAAPATPTSPRPAPPAVSATAETGLPSDLLAAQTRLHQATAELAALVHTLPWSVEPHGGWPGTKHPHTDEVTGGREPSPGWTAEQKTAVDRLTQEVRHCRHAPVLERVQRREPGRRPDEPEGAPRPKTVPAVDATTAT
ncbi:MULTISPECIES: hypothetical protein [unclassified Streptomyces]|uniref:hypothetical protein n=1 Tax=unclassified Streptomyces TaxID=2593676 RepID=UPI00159F0B65|nr:MULTISPECIES: hypothetical protein [unclassified Streptomyces]